MAQRRSDWVPGSRARRAGGGFIRGPRCEGPARERVDISEDAARGKGLFPASAFVLVSTFGGREYADIYNLKRAMEGSAPRSGCPNGQITQVDPRHHSEREAAASEGRKLRQVSGWIEAVSETSAHLDRVNCLRPGSKRRRRGGRDGDQEQGRHR